MASFRTLWTFVCCGVCVTVSPVAGAAAPTAAPAAASPPPSFPPILVLDAAEAAALPAFGTAPQRASARGPGCAALAAAWPDRVVGVQQALRAVEKRRSVDEAHALERRLAADARDCPDWAGPATVQRMLLREHHGLYAPTHGADVAASTSLPTSVGRTLDQLWAEYVALGEQAWLTASLQVGRSWAAWCAQATVDDVPARKQRYVFNLTPDDSLASGPTAGLDPHFTALARVAPLPELQARLGVLQGQGPAGARAVADYIAASVREAAAQRADRVFFVNAAAPQVPSFAEGVGRAGRNQGPALHYRDLLDWRDGSLVTPEGAATFARQVADELEAAPGKSLLVVNCNAGLDRSGTINALVQGILAARQQRRAGSEALDVVREGMAHVPQLVGALKRARPASISSYARYVFVYRALAAALAAEVEGP